MATDDNINAGLFDRVPGLRQVVLLVGLAASIAVGLSVALWSRAPGYSVLYGNLADRDAGEVTRALQTSGIPYKLDASSGAVMVPGEMVHEARIKMAAEGLPQGAGFGLELIRDEKGFGVSQFMENARYQHALETELGRTIANMRAVRNARVHLAIPRQTVFVRDRRQPSASVLINLFPGRRLEDDRVAAIVHLVASSIPDLEAGQVTVIDQHGRLLSSPDADSDESLTGLQFDYARRLEANYVGRIHELLTPLLGPGRVQATVAADLDFTVSEETRESYDPERTVVRSEQRSEDRRNGGSDAFGGVPGALSNQPPDTVAPVDAGADGVEQNLGDDQPLSETVRSTINYEVDRTVSHVRNSTGEIRRLSVAVVVDHREVRAEDGTLSSQPLTDDEIEEVRSLVREAVGFDAQRGDSVSVINSSFHEAEALADAEAPPLWEQPAVQNLARSAVGVLLGLAVIFGLVRPMVRSLTTVAPARALPAGGGTINVMAGDEEPAAPAPPVLSYEDKVSAVRQIANDDPARVAQVVREWVGGNS